ALHGRDGRRKLVALDLGEGRGGNARRLTDVLQRQAATLAKLVQAVADIEFLDGAAIVGGTRLLVADADHILDYRALFEHRHFGHRTSFVFVARAASRGATACRRAP